MRPAGNDRITGKMTALPVPMAEPRSRSSFSGALVVVGFLWIPLDFLIAALRTFANANETRELFAE